MNEAPSSLIDSYAAALSERFHAPVEPFLRRACLYFESGLTLDVTFLETQARLAVALTQAHDGQPADVLRKLLTCNFQSHGVPGATLALRDGQSHLELVCVASYGAVSPNRFADAATHLLQSASLIDAAIAS